MDLWFTNIVKWSHFSQEIKPTNEAEAMEAMHKGFVKNKTKKLSRCTIWNQYSTAVIPSGCQCSRSEKKARRESKTSSGSEMWGKQNSGRWAKATLRSQEEWPVLPDPKQETVAGCRQRWVHKEMTSAGLGQEDAAWVYSDLKQGWAARLTHGSFLWSEFLNTHTQMLIHSNICLHWSGILKLLVLKAYLTTETAEARSRAHKPHLSCL